MRSVSMPSFTACSRSSSVDAPFSTMRRSGLDIAITSYNPCRPLYPVPPHVSQPAPLKRVSFCASAAEISSSGSPKVFAQPAAVHASGDHPIEFQLPVELPLVREGDMIGVTIPVAPAH